MKKNLNNIIVFQGKNYFGRTVHFHNKEMNIDKKLLMFEETLKNAMEPYLLSDELTDEERAMAESMEDTDTEDNLHEEVVLYTIRERRILRAINNMKEVTLKGNVEISTNVSVHKKGSGADTRVVESTTTTNLERAEIAVLRLERELTSVQKAKARTLQTLDEVRRANGKDDDTWLEEFVAAIEAEDESEAEDEVSPEE